MASLNKPNLHSIFGIILLLVILLATLVPGKVINCRPLPQCCRRYVFSPACRGVAAKRSETMLKEINGDFLTNPRVFFPTLDSDYDSDYGNSFGADETDFRPLNQIKGSTNERVE